MLRRTSPLVAIFLLSLFLPNILLAKAEEKKEKEVGIHITSFEYVKRRTAWMYNLEVFNPDKNMISAKIYAKNENNEEVEIALNKFNKRGISKKFDNKNYTSLRAEIFDTGKKLVDKTLSLPEVKAEIVSFSIRNDRWFLKVRNKTVESMEFKVIIQEENTTGLKSTVLEYETQNLDPEITHNRTSTLDNLTINNRLTLIVKDIVSNKTLAAKTIKLK